MRSLERFCKLCEKFLAVSGDTYASQDSVFAASYPSLWQQEAEMWLCRLPVLTDALTSVSQHCGGTERRVFFLFWCHSVISHFGLATPHATRRSSRINKTLGSLWKPVSFSFGTSLFSLYVLVIAPSRKLKHIYISSQQLINQPSVDKTALPLLQPLREPNLLLLTWCESTLFLDKQSNGSPSDRKTQHTIKNHEFLLLLTDLLNRCCPLCFPSSLWVLASSGTLWFIFQNLMVRKEENTLLSHEILTEHATQVPFTH